MIDVSRLPPEAQPIVEQAARVYLKHTEPWLIGLIAHGSAVKGGFIPGCSDIDLQLYLESAAFANGPRSFELAINIHRDLAKIDPAPFGYIQCYPLSDKLPKGWTAPIPGAYALIAGKLPIKEAAAEELYYSAKKRLAELDPTPTHLHINLLEHGAGRLEHRVRLLCTEIWSTLYDLLTLQQGDPIRTWNLTKTEAIAALPGDSVVSKEIRRFHEAVLAHYLGDRSVESALTVIECGVAFIHAAKLWWVEYASANLT